ncbi:MAG: hypothetical protein KUG78_00730 [Kangiellaceae bacterium]|nr:hypothetical protein [Kangiellaceae bacterium]
MASTGQVVTECSVWVDPKLIIPAVCVVLASVIVPILLHHLKGRRERSEKIFDIRKVVYTEYFKKYEDAAASLGQDYEHFSKVTMKDAFYKLLESDNSSESIVEFQQTVGEFPMKVQDSHRKATQELTSLKVLGSSKLLTLTKEFEDLNSQMLTLTSEWLGELNQTMAAPDFDAPIAVQMKQLGERAELLKENIIQQMRIELRLN